MKSSEVGTQHSSGCLFILLDIVWALDAITHSILLGRLFEMGVGHTVVQCLIFYGEANSEGGAGGLLFGARIMEPRIA